jgi:hypothetical protein
MPAVYDLPAWFRGRALYRMAQTHKSMNNEHSEGVFIFGGYCIHWHIQEFSGERSITLSLGGESVV